MLICYLAVDLDGSPALESCSFPAEGDGGKACSAWLNQRVYQDDPGLALFSLALTGKPGDRYEVKQDGQIVAVVVRA